MNRTVLQQHLVLGIGLMLIGGCSMSRGNLARNSTREDAALETTASVESSEADADGPPSQPGVKSTGGARKKLKGWLSKGDSKRESIPLDRTDSASQQDAEESLADQDSGFWKHNDAPVTEENPQVAKSKNSKSENSDPFDP